MATLEHAVEITYPNPYPDPSKKGSDATCTERIGGMGPAVRSFYVQLLKAGAWEELDRQADKMTVARYTRLETALFMAMASGKYEWGDEIHTSIDGNRSGYEVQLTARILSTNSRFHKSHLEAIVNEYGWERLQQLCILADGPAPKKEDAPPETGR